jgi:hypothetical protein
MLSEAHPIHNTDMASAPHIVFNENPSEIKAEHRKEERMMNVLKQNEIRF